MYKITVEKITKTQYKEKDYRYINKETGKPCEYDDENRAKEYYETGRIKEETKTETVFTQAKEGLDVGKLAVFLNQKEETVVMDETSGVNPIVECGDGAE